MACMSMSRNTRLTFWLVVGIVLALGPIFGTLPTVIGMIASFNNLDEGGARGIILGKSISLGQWLTLAGLLLCPIGMAIIAVSAVRFWRNKNQ